MSSYIVSLPTTSYLAFKVTPKKTMTYTYRARADVFNGLFDLTSGESKKISKHLYFLYSRI